MHGRDGHQELIEFAFESRVAEGVPLATLLRLAQAAQRFNIQSELTGELHLSGESFRCIIEGPCAIVQLLAARIVADRRHGSIRIGAFGALERRRFDRWTTFGFTQEDERPAPGLLFLLPAERPVAPRRTAGFASRR